MTDRGAALPVAVGDRCEFTKTVTEDDVVAFARVTGDDQPLHLDPDFGKRTRFGKRIAHGMLSAGLHLGRHRHEARARTGWWCTCGSSCGSGCPWRSAIPSPRGSK